MAAALKKIPAHQYQILLILNQSSSQLATQTASPVNTEAAPVNTAVLNGNEVLNHNAPPQSTGINTANNANAAPINATALDGGAAANQ